MISREQVEKVWRAHWNESTHLGGDNWSDNTMYMCIDCPHYTPIIGGNHETAD